MIRGRASTALRALVTVLALAVFSAGAFARDLRVGPGRGLQKPSEAARIARDGDRILIDAGIYPADAASWNADDLDIRAVGGPVVLRALGAHAQGKGIWVTGGRNTRIEGITFEGARVPAGNGAGIRHQGLGLTLVRCRFQYNENGLLSHNHPDDTIRIEDSVFAHNGTGTGYTHGLYVGRAASLTVEGSWFHHSRVGHNVKSRARVTRLLYNRIMDETEGNASYAVDLPDGGDALLLGNVIQQGPFTENPALVSFGAESRRHDFNRLRMIHNTLVNDAAGGVFVRVHPGDVEIDLAANLLVGPGTPYVGLPVERARDVRLEDSPFVDRVHFDYRLRDDSRVVDAARPLSEGFPAAAREPREGGGTVARPVTGAAPDVGALERR